MLHDTDDMDHFDEKCFYIAKKKRAVYKPKGEKLPTKSEKPTGHLTKVVFLATSARPGFDSDGDCTFDEKIIIWPFVEEATAKRSS